MKLLHCQWMTGIVPLHQYIRNYIMMTSSNGNIFRVTGPLCVEFTGPVNSPHKGQWRGALMFSLICAWINDWVNNHEAGDLRRHRGHYDINVMITILKWKSMMKLHLHTTMCIYQRQIAIVDQVVFNLNGTLQLIWIYLVYCGATSNVSLVIIFICIHLSFYPYEKPLIALFFALLYIDEKGLISFGNMIYWRMVTECI